MLVKEFLEPFVSTSVVMIHQALFTKDSAITLYGDYKVVRVDTSPSLYHVDIVIDEPKCPCYELVKEKRYLTEYEKGYYFGKKGAQLEYVTKETSICLGTKEKDECSCEGYKSQCNFYREKFMKEIEHDKDNQRRN